MERKELRTSTLIFGVLLIISGVLDYAITPQIINKVDTLTSNIETSIIPSVDNSVVNSAYASSLTDVNSKVTQLSSLVGTIEEVSKYSSWAIIISGVGTVTFGVFAKNNRIQKNEAPRYSSEALEILKIRLAKGDITSEEFKKLKNDVV